MQSHHLDSKAKISENLGQAIYTNNLDALESIIAQGINIDLPIASPAHTKMLPPLFIAALCGHTNSVELLIENGASTCDKTGVLPNLLYWVCKCKDQDDRDELLEYLATEQIPFQDGTSTDHILAAQGRLENFDKTDPAQRNKLLIPNHSGYTPFFFAMLTLEEDVKDVVLNISPLQIIEAIWIKPLTTNYDEKFLLRHLAIAIQEHSNMGYVLFADDNLNVGFKCEQVLNLAIEKARAVVPVTLEDQTIPDVFYRHLAKLFFQKIKYLLRSKKIQEALECNLLEIKNYEQIQTLAVADNASLYTAHSLTSYFYKALGDECVATKNWQEAIQFYQKAYDANEKISPRNESDYPSLHKAYCLSLSRAWQNYGQDHDMKLNYKAAVDCFEKALNVLRRLQPTLAERLDILRHLSNSLLLLAQEQNKLKNWFSVIELLQRVLVERNDLQEAKQDKDDTDQIRRNLVRTYMVYCADLDDDWEYILRHKMFHNAIAHSSKILNLQPNDYKLLSNAYFKVGGIVGEFASQLLQLNSSITTEAFAKTWMQVYKASSDKNDESMSQMLKLLEIISQNYDSPNFPQSAFIECLKNPINKEKLNKKIAEAKEIIHKQKSLQAIVGNSPSLEIALTQKVLKIEQDCQRLQDENKALVKRNKDMESALKSLQNQVNTQSTRSDSTPRIFRPFNKHLIEEIQPQNAGNRGPKP